MLFAGAAPARGAAPEVVLHRLDGTQLRGVWVGGDEAAVRVRGSEGVTEVALADLAELIAAPSADAPAVAEPAADEALFYFADGGMLSGRILPPTGAGVTAATRFGAETQLGFSVLAGVRFEADAAAYAKAAELFAAALADRRPGQDVLITRDVEDVRSLRGALTALSPGSGTFHVGGRDRTFDLSKVFGVVFARGVSEPPASPALVRLVDGGVIGGRFLGGDEAGLRLEASFGPTVTVPLADVASVRFRSERVVFLSELTPAKEELDGRLHAPQPPRRDRGVSGGPLAAGGRTFSRGLGVHARTTLVYELGGAFETFAAAVGLDDRVGSMGSVVFRVLGDDRVLAETGTLTGDDELVDLVVPVAGVTALTLVVDYADELDLADQAVWGQARLIRPAK
jgi:hypothetical protein